MSGQITGWNGGRPNNLPGMHRGNAPSRPVDPGLIQRISGNIRSWLGMNTGPGSRELPFFPPGESLPPVAPGAAGRRWDYPTAVNQVIRPRSYEPIDFDTLRAIADPTVGGWDLIRLAIETRKDQLSKLQYNILPRQAANENNRKKADDRCLQVEQFLRRPDGHHSWQDWSRMLVEEHLVIDAPCIYGRKALDGTLARLELIDGATIKPIIDYMGRRPDSGPAYSQVLKGLPAVQYTASEMIYAPRNPRVSKMYGYSCVEQVLITVNIGLRRQAGQLGFFTEGNVPDAVSQCPPDWGVQRIQEFQDYWDTMVNDAVKRRKLKFIPGGVQFQATRNDQALVDQFDEWLARVVQYCFSLPPTPLVRLMNRATSENAYEQSLDEGLQPLMIWMKSIIDDILARWFDAPDLEMVWDSVKKTDPAEKEQRDLSCIDRGVISRDDMRAERGMEPLGIPPVVQGIGPLGFMSIPSMQKAIENGWDLTGMPQPAMGPGAGAAPGELGPEQDPALLGTGQPGDPLSGLPPEVLQALGVETPVGNPGDGGDNLEGLPMAGNGGPNGKGGGQVGVATARGPGQVIPIHQHPHIQAALRMGEAHAHRIASRMRASAR